MSGKSKKSNKKRDQSFDPKRCKKAGEMASQYQVIIGYEEDHWYGHGLEMPLALK